VKRLLFLVCGMLSLLLPLLPANAESLDDHLAPQCGWSTDGTSNQDQINAWVDEVLVRYGDEILARAQDFGSLAPTPENRQLMWLLGAMRDCEARELAAQIVSAGQPAFRGRVLGGIGYAPDWAGAEVLLLGAADSNPVVRETAIAILSNDATLSAPALLNADDAAAQADQFAAKLAVLASRETDPRLRAMLLVRLDTLAGEAQ